MNKTLEVEEAMARIQANLSNYITEISKLNGISQREAEEVLKENIKINKEVFEATGMQLEGGENDKQESNPD